MNNLAHNPSRCKAKTAWVLAFLLMVVVVTGQAFGQGAYITGRVLHATTGEPVCYANIYNISLQKGTVSNAAGYFRLETGSRNDSVIISYVGFNREVLRLSEEKDYYEVRLSESVQLLEGVTITAPDDAYLYNLVYASARNSTGQLKNARVFYELKSYTNDEQIELLEAFYNAGIRGYDLDGLEMKAGRFALKKYQDRLFLSQNTSRSILMQKLAGDNSYFPVSPFMPGKRKLKRSFYLELERKYLDDDLQTVCVISYTPKDTTGGYFSGKIWIDPMRKSIIKATMDCDKCTVHPFLPLFPSDSLTRVDLHITRTFKEVDGVRVFNHVDFRYDLGYVSRRQKEGERTLVPDLYYNVSTSAVLYAYDFGKQFILPCMRFADPSIWDYRRINAMPYNDFFWNYNDELKLSDEKELNRRFFEANESISNKTIFGGNNFMNSGRTVYEAPFIYWSGRRITIKQVNVDTLVPKHTINQGPAFLTDQYRLSVKVFMDINTYADSTHVITATIFDPFETYYRLPVDGSVACFANIYFDLHEIERRKFEKEIKLAGIREEEIRKKYETMAVNLENIENQYLKEVQHGENLEAMKKWNDFVYRNLGINNMEFFGLSGENP